MLMRPNMAVKIPEMSIAKRVRMMMAGMEAMAAFTMKTTMDQKGIWMSTTVKGLLKSFRCALLWVVADRVSGEAVVVYQSVATASR
jgi:hypothetical protein